MSSFMLGAMKSIKMMGLSGVIATAIQEQRLEDVARSRKTRMIVAILNTLGEMTQNWHLVLPFWVMQSLAGFCGGNLCLRILLLRPCRFLYWRPARREFDSVNSNACMPLACARRIQVFLLGTSRED